MTTLMTFIVCFFNRSEPFLNPLYRFHRLLAGASWCRRSRPTEGRGSPIAGVQQNVAIDTDIFVERRHQLSCCWMIVPLGMSRFYHSKARQKEPRPKENTVKTERTGSREGRSDEAIPGRSWRRPQSNIEEPSLSRSMMRMMARASWRAIFSTRPPFL